MLPEGRESSGKRETIWKGIKLKEEYKIDAKQETLDILQESAVATTITTIPNNNDKDELNLSCYYCPFQTNNSKEYDRHVVLKHPKKPAYPGKADMESLRLPPKGHE
jgi:hypothetical protein